MSIAENEVEGPEKVAKAPGSFTERYLALGLEALAAERSICAAAF